MWFASGMVMMYVDFPQLTDVERFTGWPPSISTRRTSCRRKHWPWLGSRAGLANWDLEMVLRVGQHTLWSPWEGPVLHGVCR